MLYICSGRKRNHSSIQIWGGGRFYYDNLSDIEYLGGQVKYVHQCDLNSFGLWDLIGAATECKFTSGQPTMAWYLHPDGGNTVEDLIPLNNDHDVRTMLLLGNNFRKPFVTVYTQDTNFSTSPGLGVGKYYLIPPSIPPVKTAGLRVEVKYNVLDRLSVRLTLTKEEQGLEEKLGKIWYVSCKSVPEPPCQNSGYQLRPLPCRGLSDRELLLEDDTIGQYLDENAG